MKASEKRMIMILVVLAAVCGGAILSQRLLRLQHGIERREQALELKRTESNAILAEADLWKQRLAWLQTSQPPMKSENEASKELLDGLLSSAAAKGLTVQKQTLHELVSAEFYREVGVTLTVKGALPAVFRWMHQVLTPESFYMVAKLKVVPDSADPASVTAMIDFSRLYGPELASAETPAAPSSN
jgi:Tfp pilus assembly protein PilO